MFIPLENHPADSMVKIIENDICQTLNSRMGTGGGNVPMVIAISIDSYNQTVSTEVAEPLRAAEGGDTKPKVLVIKEHEDSNIQKNQSSSR